ncbi:proton-translocating transhydrogenase family protein [endosymbiont of unidentified scaly snail isolate Monju]|uniref:proton-translocating transhydrogenase family protein n=1 Tax=endosymbiont of unidentified scaly snail isolate Monju TaxID=1248727 RepID=UPI0005BA8CE4|nr:proton-translocating transhydrogenase family protein [endosymbiont of unidentified scaly snail isolate Monju]
MPDTLLALYVFVLACFIGYFVIWGVTPALHTPLVALTNAISGIVIIGALLVAGAEEASGLTEIMGFFAVLLASINVFGGFLVTKRMLAMFKKKKK